MEFDDHLDEEIGGDLTVYDYLDSVDSFQWRAGFGGVAMFEHAETGRTVFVEQGTNQVVVSQTGFNRLVEYLSSKVSSQ